jgi:adenosylhomocysteinase
VISTRIDWVREHCRLLRDIAAEFGRTPPFDGLTIGTGIHPEAKTVALLLTLRDGVILANAGHFPAEIDAAGLIGAAEVADTTEYADDLLPLELRDGRRVHLLARGHMFNLAGPRPLGNSIESMDLGIALQARCLEAVARRSVDGTSCVVPVPGTIDAAIARAYLDRKYPG